MYKISKGIVVAAVATVTIGVGSNASGTDYGIEINPASEKDDAYVLPGVSGRKPQGEHSSVQTGIGMPQSPSNPTELFANTRDIIKAQTEDAVDDAVRTITEQTTSELTDDVNSCDVDC